ncbi:MAG: hypothetical protein OXH65_10225 [Paracoccaceae bacterium]|nr:hypothetical protein [Paracoccaceae bacterium]MDE2675472.1 hypothetical protein [Paracoccaceae bacterium]
MLKMARFIDGCVPFNPIPWWISSDEYPSWLERNQPIGLMLSEKKSPDQNFII